MLIFLILILLLAALLEALSLRGRGACPDAELALSKKRSETEEDVVLTTRIRRKGRLPVSYCELSIDCPPTARLPEGADVQKESDRNTLRSVFRLFTGKARERSFTLRMEKRGVYLFSGREIRRGDFLGLSFASSRFDANRFLLVYPPRLRSRTLTEALGSYTGLITAQRWLLRDPVLILGVREYTGNEPMHAVSWSQTARRNELTVKEFDYTRSLNCRVILAVNGLGPNETELPDLCCSAARTVCEALIAAGVEPVLSTNAALIGYRNRPLRSVSAGPGRMEDLLEVLARVTNTACCSASALAEECLEEMSDATAVVLIAPHDSEDVRNAFRLLDERSGFGAKFIAADELEEGGNG